MADGVNLGGQTKASNANAAMAMDNLETTMNNTKAYNKFNNQLQQDQLTASAANAIRQFAQSLQKAEKKLTEGGNQLVG